MVFPFHCRINAARHLILLEWVLVVFATAHLMIRVVSVLYSFVVVLVLHGAAINVLQCDASS